MIRCPRCNGEMKKTCGVNGEFYGCVSYPRCEGSRSIHKKVKYNNNKSIDIRQEQTKNQKKLYFTEIIEYFVEKNKMKHGEEAARLNYSLIQMKSSIDKPQYYKAIFRKYMQGENAKLVESVEEGAVTPFISNLTQKEALKKAFSYDLSVIQGPPGTGKTQTILNIICHAVANGKRVLVVSNNNSAIDNVLEKLEAQTDLIPFYLRLGSKKRMDELLEQIEQKVKKEIKFTLPKTEHLWYFPNLAKLEKTISEIENQYDTLIAERNILNEIYTQKRHIEKKVKTYTTQSSEQIKPNTFFVWPSQLKKEINYLRKNREKEKNLFLKSYLKLRFSAPDIDIDNYTIYQWRLEQLYANKIIKYYENKIKNIENIKNKLEKLYGDYQNEAKRVLNIKVAQWYVKQKSYYEDVLSEEKTEQEKRKAIVKLYPVVLTTLDSVISNVSQESFDYVIVDEASQANLISGLAALNAGKRVVIVGDLKQLSAIVDSNDKSFIAEKEAKFEIENKYKYSENNFLSSIISVCNPPVTLLREHYRCDFNIINYCNKKFYNSELIIYSKESNPKSMKIMYLNKEKNSICGLRKSGSNSYENKIEQHAIKKYLSDVEEKEKASIIAPYALHEESLKQLLPEMKEQIGTIYKFQGRENETILLSTVLTKEEGASQAINKEVINVGVSRAKKEFILFTHDEFFKKIDHNLVSLIDYIQTYGEVLDANVHSIFEYLYKQIPYYKVNKKFESVWEYKMYQIILGIVNEHPGFYLQMKLPLADIVGDKEFLDISDEELKKFALNKLAHVDFAIISELTNRVVLAIELDGAFHKEEIPKKRDEKKNTLLEHHNIPLWRILSTDFLEKNDVKKHIEGYINEYSLVDCLKIQLEKSSWKDDAN